MYVKRGLINI